MKDKKCKHLFESDGGQCIHCRKTQIEIWEEEEKKILQKKKRIRIKK